MQKSGILQRDGSRDNMCKSDNNKEMKEMYILYLKGKCFRNQVRLVIYFQFSFKFIKFFYYKKNKSRDIYVIYLCILRGMCDIFWNFSFVYVCKIVISNINNKVKD